LREEISRILLHEVHDPRLGFVTVVRSEVSADLRCAHIHVSVMGGAAKEKLALAAMEHARGHIQRLLAERLEVRYVPRLRFSIDESIKKGARISAIIAELARGREGEDAEEDVGEDVEEDVEEDAQGDVFET